MKPLDLILVAALGAGVAAYLALPAGAPERNLEYLPDMAYSPASKAYAANPLFPDGKVLQTPPSGTIRRGAPARFPYAATPVDALRAGAELRNPYATENLEAYTRGGVVYGRFCIPCHGGGGRGDGPVTLKGFPAPPPFASERTLKMADGQMYHAITLGGEKKMPAYGLQVAPGDRWNGRRRHRYRATQS